MLQAIFLQVTRPSQARYLTLTGIAAFCCTAVIASCCVAQSPVTVPSDARLITNGSVQTVSEIDSGYVTSDDTVMASFFDNESSVEVVEVVKNRNLFGDRKRCCDEWAGFCRMKDLSYECGCGGLKQKRGHYGIPWLRSADAGEDCDYCNGGCCKKSGSCVKRNAKKRCSVFTDAFRKSSRSKSSQSKCGCGCGEETCPEEMECESCQ